MEKSGFWDKFWKNYLVLALYLLLPAALMFLMSMLFFRLDEEPERFDRQAQGVVVTCKDNTKRTKAEREHGGPYPDYIIEAEYQVNGVTYTCSEHWGSKKTVGSAVTVLYNSEKPSDSTMNPDPVAGKKRVGTLTIGSGITLVFCLIPVVAWMIRKKKKV